MGCGTWDLVAVGFLRDEDGSTAHVADITLQVTPVCSILTPGLRFFTSSALRHGNAT
jgi:hypothetical protein